MKKVVVTGGAGFIGSALVRRLLQQGYQVLNIDKLTYAGNLENLKEVEGNSGYQFVREDICNGSAIANVFSEFKPHGVFHLAAESHVDRSIDGPKDFIKTNVEGTLELLEASRKYIDEVGGAIKSDFKFIHVSTDEVYGDLPSEGFFTESTPYNPSSPYSASKASSDFLARSWLRTFGFPTIVTNCSNNYGPYHFPEKLIPHMIVNGFNGKKLPVYGDGKNIRDWLYVEDHAKALQLVFERGAVGETYNIGGQAERTNLEVVHQICDTLDKLLVEKGTAPRRDLITFVGDRPGHDRRYAVSIKKINGELGWAPSITFEQGIERTVHWYLENMDSWVSNVLSGTYKLERLGGKNGAA